MRALTYEQLTEQRAALLEALELLLHDRTPWTVECARAAIALAQGDAA